MRVPPFIKSKDYADKDKQLKNNDRKKLHVILRLQATLGIRQDKLSRSMLHIAKHHWREPAVDFALEMGSSFGLTHLYEFECREDWARVTSVCNEADIYSQDKWSLRVLLSPNNTVDMWPALLSMLGISTTESDKGEASPTKKRKATRCSPKKTKTSKLTAKKRVAAATLTPSGSNSSPPDTPELSEVTDQIAKSKENAYTMPLSKGPLKKRRPSSPSNLDVDLPLLNGPILSGISKLKDSSASLPSDSDWYVAHIVDSENFGSFDSDDLDAEVHIA